MSRPIPYIESLTPLRGIAAFGVLLFHFELGLALTGFPLLFGRAHTLLVHRGYLWVDFFFVLSGFIITHVYGPRFESSVTWPKARAYLVARFSRIYPLHIFSLGTHVLLFAAVSKAMPKMAPRLESTLYPLDALPLHIFMLHANGFYDRQTWNTPSWSIAAEWWTYVFAIGLLPLINRGGRWRGWLAALAAVVGILLLVTLHPRHSLRIHYDFGVLRCLFEFTLGVALYQLFKSGAGARWWRRDAVFVAGAAASLAVIHFPMHDVAAAPAFALLVIAAAYNQGWANRLLNTRALRWFGDISYSFYMVQGLLLIMFGGFLELRKRKLGLEVPTFNQGVWLVVMFVLCTLAAWASYRWVEVPARGWVRRRLTKDA